MRFAIAVTILSQTLPAVSSKEESVSSFKSKKKLLDILHVEKYEKEEKTGQSSTNIRRGHVEEQEGSFKGITFQENDDGLLFNKMTRKSSRSPLMNKNIPKSKINSTPRKECDPKKEKNGECQ